jgi:peptide/nickel transport system substrate-binding protein
MALCAACDRPEVFRLLDPGAPVSELKSSGEERADTTTLIVGRPADAIGLDPARHTDNESVEACEQIYEHLVRWAATSTEIVPSLATSWSVSSGGTEWTFRLREGVTFHDGTALDADAVVFSFERQRDPKHPYHEKDFSYWESDYKLIESVTAVDAHTVRIVIDKPFAPFLSLLAMFPASIVSPTAVRKYGTEFNKHPVGTGAFKLSSWITGDRIVLERHAAYWGTPAKAERLVFRNIPDARQRLTALEGGTVHVAYAILPEELQFVELHPDLRLRRVAGENVVYVAMNMMRPAWADPEVRHAVNHAVNKVPIVKLVYQGLAVPAQGPLPPSMWGYRGNVEDYPYDPKKARALVEAAVLRGTFDKTAKYRFYVPRTPRPYLPDPEQVGRVIQRNLKEAGIETELVVQDFSQHLTSVQNGEHDLCLLGWVADNGDPDNFLYVLLDRDNATPGLSRNVAFYNNAEVHGLLLYAQSTLDRSERERHYRRVQEIVARDAPWVPLAHSEQAVAARATVENLILHPSTVIYYSGVWPSR